MIARLIAAMRIGRGTRVGTGCKARERRDLPLRTTVQGCKMYAPIQKPRGIRARERDRMEMR